MTVSPAMWVTGNMASNMSLKEKKEETKEETKEKEEEGRRERSRERTQQILDPSYSSALPNCLLTLTQKHTVHTVRSVFCGRAV